MRDGDDRGVASIRQRHFETLVPQCPVCRRAGRHSPLELRSVIKEAGGVIWEGRLVCTTPLCQSEFPVIDGVPIIVADLRTYMSQNLLQVLGRGDLSAEMESLLGDCWGPGSAFDAHRQYLSTYGFDHYGDLDPEPSAPPSACPGSIRTLLERGLAAMGGVPSGPVIDMGCALGRSSFELARHSADLVLGVDLNFSMLKTAAAIVRDGIVSYPQRREGIVFDRREFPAAFENSDHVDFWVCDATALPFADGIFSAGVSLNVLDCLQSPYDHLMELSRVLCGEGRALISTPYDWAAHATPVEAWLGGHSQRTPAARGPDAVLRSLLAGGGHPNAIETLSLIFEENLPWHLRLHNRSQMEYQVHLLAVRKNSPQ